MSTKPEAGQWWGTEFGRIYAVGPMDDGTAIVVHNEAGFIWTVSPEKFEAWTHLVSCTGWDWVVPEQPQPEDECDNLVIQDKVPVRRGIDRISWVSDDPAQSIAPSENGHSLGKMYGAPRPAGASGQHDKDVWLRVWCKQKDLPKVEQDEKSEDPDEWVIIDPGGRGPVMTLKQLQKLLRR